MGLEMNNRQAKKHAYLLAAGFIRATLGGAHYDESLSDTDNARVAVQLLVIADQLERMGGRKSLRRNRVWQEDDFG
jgi:hypothetical protein